MKLKVNNCNLNNKLNFENILSYSKFKLDRSSTVFINWIKNHTFIIFIIKKDKKLVNKYLKLKKILWMNNLCNAKILILMQKIIMLKRK